MIEQLSLFGDKKDDFAQRICDELNKLETVWKGSFYVKEANLEWWDHVKLKNKVLFICIKAKKWSEENHFIQFKGDNESQLTLYNAPYHSEYLAKLDKDKDFSISITPWCVYIFYHNWELKKV